MKQSLAHILLLITLFSLLAGCGASQRAPTAPTPAFQPLSVAPTTTGATPSALYGGNLIMTLGAHDPTTLDPALISDSTSAFVVFQLFSGLVRLDNELEVQPDLAETWEISEDGRTYTFTLRDDARFADGTPITSEDVRYSLERASDPRLAPSLPIQTYLSDVVGMNEKLMGEADHISGLRVIDEHTLSLTIDEPRSYFLSKLVHPTTYIVDQQTVEKGGNRWTERPNGSGPFEIEAWQHDQQLVIKRNVNYHHDVARLDRVTFLMGALASNSMVQYEQGKIDITRVSSFTLARVQDSDNPLSKELVETPQLSLSYIGMNVEAPPFDDKNIRQACALLIDRSRLAEVTLNDSVAPARGILPPGMPGYNPNLAEPTVDIERAKQLMRESKYGSIEGLPPIVAYGGGWTTVIQDIAEEELALPVEIRDFEQFGDYIQLLQQKEIPMYSISWLADYPDPENFLDVLFRSGSLENYSNYSNPDVDALLDEAATETDEQKRWKLYQEAEQIILDDAPIIPLYHDVEYILVKPYVKGLHMTPMGILDLSTVELLR